MCFFWEKFQISVSPFKRHRWVCHISTHFVNLISVFCLVLTKSLFHSLLCLQTARLYHVESKSLRLHFLMLWNCISSISPVHWKPTLYYRGRPHLGKHECRGLAWGCCEIEQFSRSWAGFLKTWRERKNISFSHRKNVSGIHTFAVSVIVR